MKKSYSKPDITFESFSLSTNIAAGCEEKPVFNTDPCHGVSWGKQIIFTSESLGCTSVVPEGMDEYNRLCYHNPSADYNVFNS